MNFKDVIKALSAIESDRHISQDIVIEALQEAMAKAYRKHLDIPDLLVRVDINTSKGDIHVYQQRAVVEEVEDDELEISLEDARAIKDTYQLGDLVDTEVPIVEFGRAAAVLAKNVMKQKIREAEKTIVYEEYIDKIDEMVVGIVQSVEEKYAIVDLGKTLAMMPKGAQIPGERYYEGQRINVIISEVNKETKGAQVLVSRSDANLVKRLFEREVPEIYDGIVEIKSIAREAGERTKMAVYSHDSKIDPIGACIGPKGSRVQVVMDEIKGEKIDIFEWSEDTIKLIKNALSPAIVLGVIESKDNKGLTVVVPDNQLSLAIGKKGKNARLAVRLTNLKIDIKSESNMEEQGIDYRALSIKSRIPEPVVVEEPVVEEITEIEVIEPSVEKDVQEEAISNTTDTVEIEENVIPEVKTIEPSKPEKKEEPKKAEPKVIRERGVKNDYVSRFEKFAEASSSSSNEETKRSYRKKNTSDNEERRIRMNIRDIKYEVKPEYTEEELKEIEANEAAENAWYDDEIDFDEYESYYEEDE